MGAGRGNARRARQRAGVSMGTLREMRDKYQDAKQDLVTEKAEEWQSVAWLAALADGRDGPHGRFQEAYANLHWPLSTKLKRKKQGWEEEQWTDASVDLKLLRIVSYKDRSELPVEILERIPLTELDVDALIEKLKEKIKKKIGPANAKQVEEFQLKRLQELEEDGFPMTPIASEAIRSVYPLFPERGRPVISSELAEPISF
jgi:hypothetical protein